MSIDDGETAVSLLALLKQHNLPFTADQLRRLHLEDMIPRPIQNHPVGKVGSETMYPKGTGDVLLAICSLHQQKRSFVAIAWQLWWENIPIPLARIRADLRKTIREWEHMRRMISYPGTKTLSKLAWKFLRKVVVHRFREPCLNQARKRVGAISFDTFTRIVLEIASGNFRGYTDDEAGSSNEEQKIMEKGFGLSQTAIDRVRGLDWTKNLEHSLIEMSRLVASSPWDAWLDSVSDREMLLNRDELCLLLTALESLCSAMEYVGGKRAFGGLILYQMLWQMGRKHLPFLFLAWSVIRQYLQTEADEILRAAQQWLEEGLPAYTALCQLQVEVPAIRLLLTPQRQRAAMRSEQAQMRYIADIQLFYQQHYEELMAFWKRHPEWYKPDMDQHAEH